MNCRDVSEIADSFLSQELLAETNHEIQRHVETCSLCRADLESRRRLRRALRVAFHRAPDLHPPAAFQDRLQGHLRGVSGRAANPRVLSTRWLAFAAGIVLVLGMASASRLWNPRGAAEALAREAMGDHQNCALKYRLVRMPVPLEEAARQFDSAYRSLLSAPPADIATPSGVARVTGRHSCAYGTRRFGHIIMEYRGRVVSLLMTTNDAGKGDREPDATPHVIGHAMDGLSVVSVDGAHHAIMVVGDLATAELIQLSKAVSVPLAQRVNSARP